jgi:spore maturation protein B
MERMRSKDMRVIAIISNCIIPIIIFYIIGYGLLNKDKVYQIFVDGVKEGFRIVLGITPALVGLMVAVSILRTSGTLDILAKVFTPLGTILQIPAEVIPVILIRMFSTSAANGLVFDLFKEYGTDSKIGFLASIVMSCTESIFYIMSVYFLSVNIKKTRWTLIGGLLSMAAGIATSILIANALYLVV